MLLSWSVRSRACFVAILAILGLCVPSVALAQINSTGGTVTPAAAPSLPTTTATTAAPAAPATAAPAVAPISAGSTAVAAAVAQPAPAVGKDGVAGVLVGNGVNVRQGPGTEYHIYFTAQVGYPVQVVGKRGDWLEIQFPGGTFSYVAKEFLQKIDDKTGIVTSAGVNVRSGPGKQYDKLYTVPTGHKFAILGMDPTNAWYQVAPLPGTTAWIMAQYVKMSGPVAVSEAPLPPVESSAEVTAPSEGVAVTPKVEEKPDPCAEKLAQAEQLFKTETAKENAMEWDLATLENMYNDIEANSTSSLNKELARRRLAQLDAFESVKAHSAQVEKVGTDLQKELTDLEKKREAELIAAANTGARETPYAAVGIVEKFYIQGLGGATHKLVNDLSIDFLLKSNIVDLNTLVGKKVGLKGRFEFVPGQVVRLIDVTSAEIMPDTVATEEAPASEAPAAAPAEAPAEVPATE